MIVDILQQAGYRLTESREKIISWIESRDGVFAVRDILVALPNLDKVSVYRTIDLLIEIDVIHAAVSLGGQVQYEKHGDAQSHHHHAVCTSCEVSACVPCEVKDVTVPKFSSVHHSAVYTGVCDSCAQKTSL